MLGQEDLTEYAKVCLSISDPIILFIVQSF